MSTTTTANAQLKVNVKQTNTTGTTVANVNWNPTDNLNLAAGTSGVGVVNAAVQVSGTLASAGTATIDLTAVASPLAAVGTINFAKVKCIIIQNTSTVSTYSLAIGGGSNPWVGAWSGTLTLGAGCTAYFDLSQINDGPAVSGGSKNILLTATIGTPGTPTTVSYTVTVIGNA